MSREAAATAGAVAQEGAGGVGAMAESDWDTVTVLRKKGPSAAQAKSKQVRGLRPGSPRCFRRPPSPNGCSHPSPPTPPSNGRSNDPPTAPPAPAPPLALLLLTHAAPPLPATGPGLPRESGGLEGTGTGTCSCWSPPRSYVFAGFCCFR